MTRPSRRELARDLEKIETDEDSDASGPDRVVIEDTVVGSPWPGSDLDAGEERTTTTEVEL